MKRMTSYLLIALISAQSAIFASPDDCCAPSCPTNCASQMCSSCPARGQNDCCPSDCSSCQWTNGNKCDDRGSNAACCEKPTIKPRPVCPSATMNCPSTCQTDCSSGSCPTTMAPMQMPTPMPMDKSANCPCPVRNDKCSNPCPTQMDRPDCWDMTRCDQWQPCPSDCRAPKVTTAEDPLIAKLLKLPLKICPYGLGLLYYMYLHDYDWATNSQNLTEDQKVRFNKAINQFMWLGVGVWLWDRIKADAKDVETFVTNTLSSIVS